MLGLHLFLVCNERSLISSIWGTIGYLSAIKPKWKHPKEAHLYDPNDQNHGLRQGAHESQSSSPFRSSASTEDFALIAGSLSGKLFGIMFKNTFQSGFLSILYSLGSKPLQIWDKEVVNGQIKRPQDEDIHSNVLEIVGSNVQSTYITCPADPAATLGIKLPFFIMVVKNLKKYFTFEIQILDDKNVRRRFRASNFQAVTRVKPFICTMPLKLDDGWNNIQLNLADFTRRAYGTNYVETLRVQVHANCRLRRIYFSDRLYSEEELPPEFKLYLPTQKA
ncbi:uncharacterized protein A4U43_C04F15400 [Asparagus officinalis]|uniref:CFA20 domain-containing protein n=2 Tax=Asparagus officinalis TaxID=4686 RepID=A0A5P1F1K7_ASPOF|nr:uncharacterized protein A4U43_C04F15400 [Asparagus officinalis]